MSKHYQLTIEVDTLAELVDVAAMLGGRRDAVVVTASTDRECSGGHGDMRTVPAGIAKSGPRIGQPYPAFLKCDVCGERRELRV